MGLSFDTVVSWIIGFAVTAIAATLGIKPDVKFCLGCERVIERQSTSKTAQDVVALTTKHGQLMQQFTILTNEHQAIHKKRLQLAADQAALDKSRLTALDIIRRRGNLP